MVLARLGSSIRESLNLALRCLGRPTDGFVTLFIISDHPSTSSCAYVCAKVDHIEKVKGSLLS
jgi:hypothetical protein